MVLSQIKRKIIKDRFKFLLYEICVCFLLIFCVSILEWVIIPISLNSEIFGMLFYVIRAIIVFFAILITIYLMDKYFSSYESKLRKKSNISTFSGYIMLYRISKSNFKYQILYGVLLLFLVFIPLDFLLYLLVPEMLTYHFYSMGLNILNNYLFIDDFVIFLTLLIVIQTCIVFTEESIYRGFVLKRASEKFNPISAVLISAYFYSFSVLNFFINSFYINFSILYPFIWFFPLFIIGIILSLLTLRKNWLFPAIFSHSMSNVLMIYIIWCFSNGWKYIEILLFIYFPLLVISLILLIYYYNRIKDGISIGLKMLKKYVTDDDIENESKSDKYLRIFVDIIIGFFVFIVGLLIAV